jgi:uncharacterized membrane protein
LSALRHAYATAICSLTGLIVLSVAWELWFAPLRPGGSWIVLKALPLLAPLRGILAARPYTYRWAAMLALAYFIEGVTRAYADEGVSRQLAALEILLALVFITAAVTFVRRAGRLPPGRPRQP